MCIDCHRSSMLLVAAAITLGKGADYPPPSAHSAEDQAVIGECMKIALGDMARLLELTIFNNVDPDGKTFGFRVTEENARALSEFAAMLSNERLWWMDKLLGQLRAQFDVTEDVAIDMLRQRGQEEIGMAVKDFLSGLFGNAAPGSPQGDASLN